MADHAYTNLTLNGDFTADGETFIVSTDLNGVAVRLFTLYVGEQREAFTDAHTAGQSQPAPEQPQQ